MHSSVGRGGLGSAGGGGRGHARSKSGGSSGGGGVAGAGADGGAGALGARAGSRGLVGGRRGRGRRVVAIGLDDLDGLERARLVAVDVLLNLALGGSAAASVVDNVEVLVVGLKGSLGEVGHATRPLNGALGSARMTSNPATNLDLHGGLGVLGTGLGTGQGADNVVINEPLDALAGPVNGVLVGGAQSAANGVESTAVKGALSIAAKIVGLGLIGLESNPLPVNLVEVGRLENKRSDNTGAGSRLDLDVDVAEEDVLVGLESRGLLNGLDGEDGAVGVVLDVGAGNGLDGVASAGEAARDLALSEGRVSRAGCEKRRVSKKAHSNVSNIAKRSTIASIVPSMRVVLAVRENSSTYSSQGGCSR